MPLIDKGISSNHYGWAIWKIEEDEQKMFNILPVDTVETKEKFPLSQKRRIERLASRAALYQLTGGYKHVAYDMYGRPYLEDESMFISLSHTKGYAAAVIGDRPVGIDIERYSEKVCNVKSYFIRADEEISPYLGNLTWSLLLHWSAKETIFKAIGQQSVDFKEHLRIYPFKPKEDGIIEAQECRTETRQLFKVFYQIRNDFVLTMTETNK